DAMRDPRLARNGGRVEHRPADEHEVGTEAQRLEDIRAAPDAAVQHDLHAAAHGRYTRQYAQGRGRAVQLAATVIGHDDAIGAMVRRQTRVFGRQNALDDERPLPQAPHQRKMLPAQVVAQTELAYRAPRDDRG